MQTQTTPAPRSDSATIAARVAAWRSHRPVVASATTEMVAIATEARRPRGQREALAALPSRRWSR